MIVDYKYLKLILFASILLFSIGCKQSKFETLKSKAMSEYEFVKHDFYLNCFDFEGPLLLSYKVNENSDTVYIEYGWNFVMDNDTFWVYYYGHVNEELSDGVYLSENIDTLINICFEERKKSRGK
jgi:hypothetical protein